MTAQDIVKVFAKEYTETTGEKYIPVWGRDVKFINRMLVTFDADHLEKLIKAYFKLPYKIYSLVFFCSGINEVIQAIKNQNADPVKRKRMVNLDTPRYE